MSCIASMVANPKGRLLERGNERDGPRGLSLCLSLSDSRQGDCLCLAFVLVRSPLCSRLLHAVNDSDQKNQAPEGEGKQANRTKAHSREPTATLVWIKNEQVRICSCGTDKPRYTEESEWTCSLYGSCRQSKKGA